ncbi:MAG: hypothetical protein QM621_03030 [Aeromicrobium sp.]|uniref:hypothetical protein n=1 Tax=Aeromicrobium sp. TaxID=1871063 RepID=UPI0039E4F2C6
MSRPLPPEVYRRRRIVVGVGVLGLILLVWLIVRLLTGGGGDEKDAEPTPTPTATETTQEAADGMVRVGLATSTEPCAPESVRIAPLVPEGQTAGADVQMTLGVSTSGDAPCLLDAAAAELVVVIDDGEAPVYDSTACPASLLTAPVALNPEWVTAVTVTWDGRVSGSTCGETEAAVPAGAYTVKLGTLGGEPGEAAFTLAEAPPAPEPTPSPTPTPAPAA